MESVVSDRASAAEAGYQKLGAQRKKCSNSCCVAKMPAGGPNLSPVVWDAVMLPFPK